MKPTHFLSLVLALMLPCSVMAAPMPPKAEPRPFEVASPHGKRTDPYYWLRDDQRSDKDMLAYLKAENAYHDAMSAPYKPLADKLFKEMVARIKQDESTVPYPQGDYRYYTRFVPGKEYPVYARKPLKGEKEQVLIDGNREARGKPFYEVGALDVAPDQQQLAWFEDASGRRQYTLRIRNLATGKLYPETITGLSPALAWSADSRTIFYIENDPVTLLGKRIKRHTLGTDPKTDTVIYTEDDDSFFMGLGNSGDDRYVLIQLESTTTSEIRVIDAAKPNDAPTLLAPRERGIKYQADHIGSRWIIRTDWQAPNYQLMQVADGAIGSRANWQALVAHDRNVFIQQFALFRDHLVINERSGGLLRIRVMPWAAPDKAFHLDADEPAYTAEIDINAEQDTHTLRYQYTSLTTPKSIIDVDMNTGKRTVRKVQAVLGNFKAENYVTERIWVTARDGVKVPVSLVYRKGFKRDGSAPLYQYAYGAYGMSSDPEFRSSQLALLDRGFVYAIAHIRGGQEMGRDWYEQGKLKHKQNTFNDFVDVTDALVNLGYGARDKVFGMGGSAGGLLMGAVANQAGMKYRALIAHVPFVDVVTTMLDESIPLTTNEFDEWGNPKLQPWYDIMLAYSPYDQVKAQPYPAMLVTTGLHDSQVQYYEPAKWVAKLRTLKTDTNPLLFKINMQAGHGGKSGRFARVREVADEYAFVLNQAGITR
ncbi:S9 family peptidase [Chitinimonas sp. BJYL2]|uniref:S9 family peptidase n=1 Tax=Chitinimonas sp. BJYL2 TaxID=2976696 RepID=UPI0022B38C98|nr:S9 family peptidase [Chitinimonas sp. BJYL2]